MTNKSVLITGTGSGIGRASALALAARGFQVFAGTLNQGEADALDRLGVANLRPVVLNVTDGESVAAALESVCSALGAGRSLDALVSNAGVTYNAPLAYLSQAEIRQMIDVNLVGPVLLIKAALPMLLTSGGRIVMVGSATALMPPPTISVYAATKCGIAGLGDSLRVELALAGVSVSMVEPGVVRTPMTAGAPALLAMFLDRMTAEDRGRYEGLMRRIVGMSATDTAGVPPETVAGAILRALTDARPKPRYRVGADCRITALLRHLPDRTRDALQRRVFGL